MKKQHLKSYFKLDVITAYNIFRRWETKGEYQSEGDLCLLHSIQIGKMAAKWYHFQQKDKKGHVLQ